MKKILKIILFGLAAILLLAAAGFLVWAETPAQPGPAALAALESDGEVYVFDKGEYILFYPAVCQVQRPGVNLGASGSVHPVGFVFYPGGRVDYRAYAPALRKIAEQGFIVVLVPVRLNLAFFDLEAGAPALTEITEVEVWAVGGHSLGGVAASLFAQNHPEIRGLVYWASYPTDDSLKTSGTAALSIYGTLDGLSNGEKIEASKANLPAGTLFVPIEGGNHAQFGDYGPQEGDQPASIPAESQWEQVANATVEFLQSLNP